MSGKVISGYFDFIIPPPCAEPNHLNCPNWFIMLFPTSSIKRAYCRINYFRIPFLSGLTLHEIGIIYKIQQEIVRHYFDKIREVIINLVHKRPQDISLQTIFPVFCKTRYPPSNELLTLDLVPEYPF